LVEEKKILKPVARLKPRGPFGRQEKDRT
jgi:hypothetical protein